MWKNRAGYVLMIVVMLVLFFCFGQPFLLWIAVGMAVLAVLMLILARLDAAKIRAELLIPASGQEGRNLTFALKIDTTGRIWSLQELTTEIQIENRMFGTVQKERISVALTGKEMIYKFPVAIEHCGQLECFAEHIYGTDVFGLSVADVGRIEKKHCVCYPHRMKLQVEMSAETIGMPKTEGHMQNRKGNDPGEIYDMKEYTPGDDIRFIHWKLSGKTDTLVLREPSELSHYRVAVLADYGVENWEKEPEEKKKEWDTIIAAGSAICRELVTRGEKFCIIFPGNKGLKVCEIRNRQEYVKMLTQWMGMPMQRKQGTGLKYFINQHMEKDYSRLVILSAGRYAEKLTGVDQQIGITVVCAVSERDKPNSSRTSDTCEVIEIPAKVEEEAYHMICQI